MTLPRFLNALKILRAIDRHEMVLAGALTRTDLEGWEKFRRHPYEWLIHAEDGQVEKVWQIIEARQSA